MIRLIALIVNTFFENFQIVRLLTPSCACDKIAPLFDDWRSRGECYDGTRSDLGLGDDDCFLVHCVVEPTTDIPAAHFPAVPPFAVRPQFLTDTLGGHWSERRSQPWSAKFAVIGSSRKRRYAFLCRF